MKSRPRRPRRLLRTTRSGDCLLPSPIGRGLGEGLSNQDHICSYLSKKLFRRVFTLNPHPQPFSQREKGEIERRPGHLLRNALPLSHSQLTIYPWNIYCFDRAIGPPDFELLDTGRRAQTKMKRHVILRSITATADHISPLADLARSEISRGADGVARRLFGQVAD